MFRFASKACFHSPTSPGPPLRRRMKSGARTQRKIEFSPRGLDFNSNHGGVRQHRDGGLPAVAPVKEWDAARFCGRRTKEDEDGGEEEERRG